MSRWIVYTAEAQTTFGKPAEAPLVPTARMLSFVDEEGLEAERKIETTGLSDHYRGLKLGDVVG